jgi:hypothetical protein
VKKKEKRSVKKREEVQYILPQLSTVWTVSAGTDPVDSAIHLSIT